MKLPFPIPAGWSGAKLAVIAGGAGLLLMLIVFFSVKWTLESSLPTVESIRTIELAVPLRVTTRDGKLIGLFGTERRALIRYADMPQGLINAFLAAEDDRFFDHGGVDYAGLLRAALKLATSGDKAQGGSTITMQLARNVFLTSEKTFTRKFREMLLAGKIEDELSKEEILELYLNKIYLGERAYGVGAAALVYFDRSLSELSLAQMATLAGLPKAPSRDNPVANPQRAEERRNYVLRRMRDLGKISEAEYQASITEPMAVRSFRSQAEVEASFVAEMVRNHLYAQYGESIYSKGLTVTTTLDSRKQQAANRALARALLDYEERRGYRLPKERLDAGLLQPGRRRELAASIDNSRAPNGLTAAVVLSVSPGAITAATATDTIEIGAQDFKWANFSDKKKLAAGDRIYVREFRSRWRLAQKPEVEGAFVALDPKDGAIVALCGGYDFFQNKFNHVTQARRQAGSGFKPFLYAAALSQGYHPGSIFLDAPVVFESNELQDSWRPENYDSEFNGPMRLREALVQSRNLVSVRLLQAVGIGAARDFASRFGLAKDRLPRDLTMALGTADYTPLEMAKAYATIANGGFLIEPYFIEKVQDGAGSTLFEAQPKMACRECEISADIAPTASAVQKAPVNLPPENNRAPRVVDAQTIWLLTSMMHDVTTRGTAASLNQLGRNDLAGKTGTTNDETDAWFNGFQSSVVGIAWVGYDQPKPLGRGEAGGRTALPIWMEFMRTALKGVPQSMLPRPSGLVDVRINPRSGLLASANSTDAITETVSINHMPEAESDRPDGAGNRGMEELF